MNKSLIIVLAICLVSVHAFVKRDAPAATPQQGTNYAEVIGEKLKEAQEGLEKVFKDITDPQKAKDAIDQFSASVNGFVEQLKPKEAPKA